MRLLLVSFLIFATVFFSCSALPEGKGKAHSIGLLESARGHGNPLQRRKPPVKIPGPKLSADEDNPGLSPSSPEKKQKMKKLSGNEKDRDNKQKRNGDRKEETQGEKSSMV